MKICIVAEGCYPYVVGGVSGWINSMICAFPNIEFEILAIISNREGSGKFAYDLPDNVTAVYEAYLDDYDFKSDHPRFEKKKLLIAVLTVSLTGWLLSLLSFTVPWCISQGLVCVFFIYLGYTAKKKKLFTEGIDTKKKIIYAITVVIPTIVIRTLGFMDGMADSVYPFGMLTVIWNGLFCLIIIYLFLLLKLIED